MQEEYFGSDHARDKHYSDKHPFSNSNKKGSSANEISHDYKDPFPRAWGYLIDKNSFHGGKFFGWFECIACGKSWFAARAF
jgi:hypothetical protein